MENRITDLEIKLTHQDDLLEQLNQVIISQQQQIDLLEQKVESLMGTGKSISGVGVKDISDEVPPPHY